MDHPLFWGVLAVTAGVGGAVRLAARRPLWPRHSRAVSTPDLVVAALTLAVLAFHCAAMFFADWVDAVPFAEAPADAVRAQGLVSQVAYWVPGVGLAIALRRIWSPALGLLVVTLVGVGYTMFVPHPLATHLAWLGAAVLTVVLIATALVSRLPQESRVGA